MRYFALKCGNTINEPDNFVVDLFKVPTLESHRVFRNTLYAFKIINNLIDAQYLSDAFHLHEILYEVRKPMTLN